MSKHPCKKGEGGAPCKNIRLGEAYDTSQCRLCWLFAHDSRYNFSFGGDGQVTLAPSAPVAVSQPSPPKPSLLGDAVESALSAVGITKERVAEWIGGPCGCKERQQRLNDLHQWAKDTVGVTVEKGRALLGKLIGKVL